MSGKLQYQFKGSLETRTKEKNYVVRLSKWNFSKEDLEEIQKTGSIYLSITGTAMPPVSIFTEYPFVKS